MSDMLQTIFSAMIGLLGVVAGALATWHTMRWRILREEKRTACSEVFKTAMQFVDRPTKQNQTIFVAAAYNARILFGDKSTVSDALRTMCTMASAVDIETLLWNEQLNKLCDGLHKDFERTANFVRVRKDADKIVNAESNQDLADVPDKIR